ncbi:hypothetical protein GJ688_12420 [Heliobacillus mobilis]|uniref:Uncharacterized protein n=1 Tax=Heliobacterium mobile TaxID=28064 RepID=A0A6I3SNB8_HELMO|nr:hypothetical protein [Heliobacterium mobile]MTV49777.1 hypothetical protein [Heliobacterium mobile]
MRTKDCPVEVGELATERLLNMFYQAISKAQLGCNDYEDYAVALGKELVRLGVEEDIVRIWALKEKRNIG